jgi:hypothetical protein
LDKINQYLHVGQTPNNSVPSFPLQSTYPTATERYQQSVPHDKAVPFQKRGKGATAKPPRSYRRPTALNRTPRHRRRHFCHDCGKGYVQSQGLKRHQRETHEEGRLCIHCGIYRVGWARPYLLKEHIKREHPHINLDTELEGATGVSRNATPVISNILQEDGSPLTPEYDGSHNDESQSYPLMLPPLAITQSPPASPPAVSAVYYNPQSYAQTHFSFIKEHSPMAGDLDLSALTNIRFALPISVWRSLNLTTTNHFRYRKSQSGHTATNRLFNEVTGTVLEPAAPVSGYSSDPVYVTPTTDPPGSPFICW